MNEPRIVTPQEAQEDVRSYSATDAPEQASARLVLRYAHTVVTEPERIAAAERAAVVKALETYARAVAANPFKGAVFSWSDVAGDVREWTQGIENGAPL